MSRSGLGRFGIIPPTIIRDPARDDDGWVICPECGLAVGDSKGTHQVDHPDLVDEDLTDEIEKLLVHGWKCNRHTARVVLPANAGGPGAPGFVDGWTSVEVVLADGRNQHVPVPERELPDYYDSTTEGSR